MQTSYELPSSDGLSGQDPQPEARQSDPGALADSSIASEVQIQSAPQSGGEVRLYDNQDRLVRCKPDELHLHTSCTRHKLTVPAWKLSAIENLGHFAFRAPLAITRGRTILDGHARWELAKKLHRTSLSCIEYDLSEPEALEWILRAHRQSSGLNAFNRISLALDMEPFFQEKARFNQRFSGQQKVSSKLTPAQRVDVRAQIASAAGASAGNVSKVKELAVAAHPDVLRALRNDEVSIHHAWTWCKRSPRAQLQALWDYRAQKGVNRTIKRLISQHQPKILPQPQELSNLLRRLANTGPDELHGIGFAVIPAPGKAILVTEELLRAFTSQLELCATSNQ